MTFILFYHYNFLLNLLSFAEMLVRLFFLLHIVSIQCFFSAAQDLSDENQKVSQQLLNNFDPINIIGVYPNPATDYIIIEIKTPEYHNIRFALTSMIGNEIEITPELLGEDKFRIGLIGYPAGFYFLVIRDDLLQFKKAFRFLIK